MPRSGKEAGMSKVVFLVPDEVKNALRAEGAEKGLELATFLRSFFIERHRNRQQTTPTTTETKP